jgi:glycine cleavage system H lipoate-binding protein
MGEFSYVNIFETKGLEYLVVIGFLVSFFFFWRLLSRPARRPAAARAPLPATQWFQLADGLHFHTGHSWARVEQDGVVTVGLDDFAHKLLGRPDGLSLPQPGASLQQGEVGWSVQVEDEKIQMLSPVSGEVLEVNEAAVKDPSLVGAEPYGQGWLARIRSSRLGRDLRNLLSGQVAAAWIQQVERGIRERMAGELGMVMQDGGAVVPGIARSLAPERWQDLARELLRTDEVQQG